MPKFVKQYTNIGGQIKTSLNEYVQEVKSRHFPEQKHTFTMKDDELQSLYGGTQAK
jgi:3-methyl-2-oxobutanoate hydroxymethyltransferase